jgi:hypothetical protein
VEGWNIFDNLFFVQGAMPWADESEQDLTLLFLNFEKACDCIDWGFLLMALMKFSFNNYWIN